MHLSPAQSLSGEFDGLAYGVPNAHFWNHWHYYLTLRHDLAYSAIHGRLEERLREAGLLAADPPTAGPIDGAWLPSPAYTYVARRFK